MNVSEEFVATIKHVSDMLKYRVEATPVEGEMLSIPCEGQDGKPLLWEGQMTTYTLGLILSGALVDAESSSTERR